MYKDFKKILILKSLYLGLKIPNNKYKLIFK